MSEIIVLSREQYKADIAAAAKMGAEIALRNAGHGDEWVSYEEAKRLLDIKCDISFRRWRMDNNITGAKKVRTVGNRKQFNKKYLING